MNPVIQYLRQLVRPPMSEGSNDGELLQRFADCRDEAAFATLLRRHGPMVLSVCRGLLRNSHDADDAFQATFLVLVRRAGSLHKRACLGSWLYGVAYRTALNARRAAARREARERRAQAMPNTESPEQMAAERELAEVLHEEVNRLPARYRAPIVLCYLEGKTNEEAARRLCCPKGTVVSRLARGRDRLRGRLVRRGVVLSGSGLAARLAEGVAPAALPAPLLTSTVTAAVMVAGGEAVAAGVVSPGAAALAEGVLQAMLLTKLKVAAAVVLSVALLGTGTGLLVSHLQARGGPLPKGAEQAKPEEKGYTEPPGVPLEAHLVARKDRYVLELAGKTPEEFRKLLNGAHRDSVPAPAVDLELEFRNSGDKDLTFLVGGTNPDIPLLLKLDGPGAVNMALPALNSKMKSDPPTHAALAPDKSYNLAINSLRTQNRGREGTASYWTQAGEYTVTATYQTAVSPAPEGAKDAGNGFGRVTVTSAPVTLKVVEK
jgi:RNA polymerase sigma factor (sigma-70 family)